MPGAGAANGRRRPAVSVFIEASYSNYMLPEVAKLLVGFPRYGMTLNTPRPAEKEQSASHLRIAQRGRVAARKLIDRGVGKRQTFQQIGKATWPRLPCLL